MKEFWDERFSKNEYIYGTSPNGYFASKIIDLKVGKILFPGEGEGRNSVFAAKSGWSVDALDYSQSGKTKAMQLAKINNVDISYEVCNLINHDIKKNYYDAVVMIFVHFLPDERVVVHNNIKECLKDGGFLIAEFFSKEQIKFNSGGPKNLSMLYNEATLRNDFKDYKIIELYETEIELNEGNYHQGKGKVIRLFAQK